MTRHFAPRPAELARRDYLDPDLRILVGRIPTAFRAAPATARPAFFAASENSAVALFPRPAFLPIIFLPAFFTPRIVCFPASDSRPDGLLFLDCDMAVTPETLFETPPDSCKRRTGGSLPLVVAGRRFHRRGQATAEVPTPPFGDRVGGSLRTGTGTGTRPRPRPTRRIERGPRRRNRGTGAEHQADDRPTYLSACGGSGRAK